MEKDKIGAFIARLRRQKGLTQLELAEKLCVSDKAVSRWETGKGLPDSMLLKPLSDELGVSVGELLSGKELEDTELKAETDNLIIEALGYSKRNLLRAGLWALLLLGMGLLVSPLFLASGGGAWPMGAALSAAALVYICAERKSESVKTKGRVFSVGAVLSLCAALALEALPFGAVLVFASGPETRVTETFSYFSPIPLGYANFWPIITALLTVAALALSAAGLFRKNPAKKAGGAAFILTALGFGFSLLPLIYGGEFMNTVSYAVSGSLFLSCTLAALGKAKG